MAILRWFNETLVNSTFPGNQTQAAIAALSTGGYVVVWRDAGTGAGDIRAQRFSDTGAKVGGQIAVASEAASEAQPDVVGLASGQFMVSWNEGATVLRETFGNNGISLGSAINVAITGVTTSALTATGNGREAVIAYDNSANGGDVRAVFYSPSGLATTIVSPAHPASAAQERTPDLTRLDGGRIAIAYSTPNAVAVSIYEAAGTFVTNFTASIGLVNTSPRSHSATALSNGNLLVTWDARVSTAVTMVGRVFAPDGTAITSELVLATPGPADRGFSKSVPLRDGGFMALWIDFNDSARNLTARTFDSTGTATSPEFVVPTHAIAGISMEQIDAALLADGRVAVIWTDSNPGTADTDGSSIRLQIIDPRNGLVQGSDAHDRFHGNDAVNDTLNGRAGDDTLFGYGGDDVLNGGTGNDTMTGGLGNDTYFVDSAGDVVTEFADSGTDTVRTTLATYALPNHVESLIGTGGSQYLVGNALNNVIIGSATASTIEGHDGNDQLYGGAGNDYIVGGDGNDTIVGLGGQDSLYGGDGSDYIVSGDGPGAVIDGGAGANSLWGGSGNDYMVGGELADLIVGFAGSDYLFGNAGDDTLYGGRGTDYIYGNAGNDFIWTDDVGAPQSTDFIYVGGGTGVDTVADFTPTGANADVVVVSPISGVTNFAQAQAAMTQAGVYTVLTMSSGDQLYLYNVQPFQLTAANFIFI